VHRQVPWHRLRYGDGWTPLMAAAVADHYSVAHWLLLTAGTQEAAQELINAANRYGQIALHIAARKGSLEMLRLLLYVGGASMLRRADALGETPVDVAVKHSHAAAVEEFGRVSALA
jgi:ankyrin repeat protein